MTVTVSARMLAEASAAVEELANTTPLDLSALETLPALLAFCATSARGDGSVGEADLVEIVCRMAGVTPGEAREAARTLRPLGYVLVAQRLELIAGRRKHALAPLV